MHTRLENCKCNACFPLSMRYEANALTIYSHTYYNYNKKNFPAVKQIK